MRCDACLVVGGAPAVEPAVALGRDERRGYPLTGIPFWLHVVVRVQQHGWCARRRGVSSDDGGCSALADDPYVVETGFQQQLRHGIGTSVHLTAAGDVGPHPPPADP